jgi:hypothetical protein
MDEREGAAVDVPRDRMRAGDSDRELAARRLQRAQSEGRLDLHEFDERVRQVWAARTYGELAQVTVDLPFDQVAASPPVRQVPATERDGMHGAVSIWLSVSVVNLVIWAVVCLATMGWVYPWWVWVAGPWGAVLLARWVTGRVEGVRRPA